MINSATDEFCNWWIMWLMDSMTDGFNDWWIPQLMNPWLMKSTGVFTEYDRNHVIGTELPEND